MVRTQKTLLAFILLQLLVTACSTGPRLPIAGETLPAQTTVSAVPTDSEPTPVAAPSLAGTITPAETIPTEATVTGKPSVTPVPSLTPSPTPLPPDLSISSSDVYLYPNPSIFAGDKVTFQVLPYVPDTIPPEQVTIDVLVDDKEVAQGTLGGVSHLSGKPVGLFEWAWNTSGQAGTRRVQVLLDRADVIVEGDENADNNAVILEVVVGDVSDLPLAEANAIWKMAESPCCLVNVVSGTAADRDLPQILTALERATQQARSKLGVQPESKYEVYLVDRVIGQGGYAGASMVVSYLDRDYAYNDLHQLLVHEAVHLLDRQFAPQRVAFLAEGLAVWASGGHYKREDINQAAAALLDIGLYVPLEDLINRFYPVQHEIGYLEAAGLVTYLIDSYGWSSFRDFYSDVTHDDADTLAEAFNLNLRQHFGLSLGELESAWRAHLEALSPDSAVVRDLQTTIRYYNTMRQYQMLYDPTAHFQIAWLPSPSGVRESGNPADLTRHPETPLNITLEVMFIEAGAAMRARDYSKADALLSSIERVLASEGQFVDPFALNYGKIVQTVTDMGFEVQRATLSGDQARVLAIKTDATTLAEIDLVLNGQEWMLSD